MSIHNLLSHVPALTLFIQTHNNNTMSPCPAESIETAFPAIPVKKILMLMAMNGDIVGTRGRNGGYMTADFHANYDEIRAQRKTEKAEALKAIKAASKVATKVTPAAKTFIPVGASGKTDVCGNPLKSDAPCVDSVSAASFVSEIRSIINKSKTAAIPAPAPVVDVDDSDDDSDEDDINGMALSDEPSEQDLEDDNEYSDLIADMNDIVGASKFSEAE
jgi:hypothetical protein